jgi:ubiquinone/menaquinone biosynthesis C-methylase UbiE
MRTHSSDDASTGQVSTTAAEVYEEFFVPALFAQWAAPMLDAVDARLGERLIDIGTGTGVLARAALRRVGPTGSVIAVDPNEGMLAFTPWPPSWTFGGAWRNNCPSLTTRRPVPHASSR